MELKMERFKSVPYSLVATCLMVVAILYAVSTEVELKSCSDQVKNLKNSQPNFTVSVQQNTTSRKFKVKKIASKFSQRTILSNLTSSDPLTVTLIREESDAISTVFLMRLTLIEQTDGPDIISVWFA
jgi:biopolymer transport protein ExbD